MSNWTEEEKQKVVDMYVSENPTPETSVEIIKGIAEQLEGKTSNGVRMVLIQAGVHVKKGDAVSTTKADKAGGTAKTGEGTKRVSKESQIAALKAAIEAKGKDIDDDVLSKLTGKAAAYITGLLT